MQIYKKLLFIHVITVAQDSQMRDCLRPSATSEKSYSQTHSHYTTPKVENDFSP